MFWGTIHRMILMELLKIFVIALISLTGIILLAGIISEAMRNGFGPAQILAIIPLLLPSLLPYTVPTTTLFATCIVYGRLSADNEILALKAAGIHIIHVVWPALFLGIVTTIVTLIFYIDLIPSTGFLVRSPVVSDVEELLYMMLRKDGCIKHDKINWEIHVNSMQGKKLYNVIFKRKSADGGFDTIAVAKEAELHVHMAKNEILVEMHHCHISQRDGAIAYVESRFWPVELPSDFDGSNRPKHRSMDMTWDELFAYLAKAETEKQKLSQDIDLLQSAINLGTAQSNARATLERLISERRGCEEMIFSIYAEFHMRPALSIGCLCFALVGCPIGIWFSKSDYLSAFITCFLPIVVIYYPLMFCMFDMGRVGKVPPWLGIYLADSLLMVAGVILFRKLARN